MLPTKFSVPEWVRSTTVTPCGMTKLLSKELRC
jgi:hypothetical protein